MLECYKIEDAAKMLKVSADTLNNLHKAGKISFVKIGNRNRITSAELERFLKAAAEPSLKNAKNEIR